jgi:WD40 repeat protein
VQLWDPPAAALKRVLVGHGARPDSIAFSPDGKHLASFGGGQIGLWDIATGRRTAILKSPAGFSFEPVSYSPDGRSVLTADPIALYFWDAQTGRLRPPLRPAHPAARFRSFALSPDGATVATGEGAVDATAAHLTVVVRLYRARTGSPLRTLCRVTFPLVYSESKIRGLPISRDELRGVATMFGPFVHPFLYAPDGKTLAAGTVAGLLLFDAHTGRLRHTLRDCLAPIAFSPDGGLLASADRAVWDTRTGSLLRRLAGFQPSPETTSITFSPDGRQIALGDEAGTVRWWDTKSGRLLATLTLLSVDQDRSGAPSDQWIFLTPDGYYDGSAGVEQYIRWRVGGQLLPAEAYEHTYHRPDLVRKSLRGEPAAG